MPVETVNIGEYGYMPFSFDCAMAVYNGGIYIKFAVFLCSDNSAFLRILYRCSLCFDYNTEILNKSLTFEKMQGYDIKPPE